MYDVKVPPIKALMPILAKFFLWFGAISPIPEICIATEEKLAKPDSANVVIIKLFSEINSLTESKSVNANASFNTNLVPSNEPTVFISLTGIPIKKANIEKIFPNNRVSDVDIWNKRILKKRDGLNGMKLFSVKVFN